MPPRLNKRQQRELEELEALGKVLPESTPAKSHEPRSKRDQGNLKQGDNRDDDEDGGSGSDEEEEVVGGRGKAVQKAGFSALLTVEGDDDSEDEETTKTTKSKKSKKKKKKPTSTATPTITSNVTSRPDTPSTQPDTEKRSKIPAAPSVPLPKNEKKALKKAKAKEKKADKDDFDKALAELSIKYPELQSVVQSNSSNTSNTSTFHKTLTTLLTVSPAHLDGEAEMRKFFGSKVVLASKSSSSSPSSGGASNARRRNNVVQRSSLTKPKSTWWPAKFREGLSIRMVPQDEVLGKAERYGWVTSTSTSSSDRGKGKANAGLVEEERWWTVEYSKKYKVLTRFFMQTVQSGDPQGFWDLMGKLPYHADTLLQVAEVYRHREEYAQAVDFVERALFTYERAFVGAFTLTSGVNRLDFDYVENRPFFLALHRQVTDLQRRGCVRTAFEFARLLYSLEPWTDPHGALLHMEYLAVKAGMADWFIEVFDLFETRRLEFQQKNETIYGRMDPSVLPGWAYSRALTLWMKEDSKKEGHEQSTTALVDAIRSFPSVVPLLADKIDATIPSSIRGHKDFRIETDGQFLEPHIATLHLLSHLYAQRCSPLWKDTQITEWFTQTVTSTFSDLTTSSPALPPTPRHQSYINLFFVSSDHSSPSNSLPGGLNTSQTPLPPIHFSVYRHIMMLDSTYRRLISFIPRPVVETKSLACDPLPPPTSISQYDDSFFSGIEDGGEGMFGLTGGRARRAREQARMIERLIPDAAFRDQLQGLFEANPQFAARFPGGLVQFIQMVRNLPDDALQDLLIAGVMGDGADGGGGGFGGGEGIEEREPGAMPGGMDNMFMDFMDVPPPGAVGIGEDDEFNEEDGGEDDEDEEEEEEDISVVPRTLRAIARIFTGGFVGGAVPQEDSSDDDAPGGSGGGGGGGGQRPLDDAGVD